MIHELKPLALIFPPLFSPDAFLFLQEEIKGLSNVEKVLLDTADSVMDTKKKLEFGVQQIIFKVRAFIYKQSPFTMSNTETSIITSNVCQKIVVFSLLFLLNNLKYI